jgi:hypothetical protein
MFSLFQFIPEKAEHGTEDATFGAFSQPIPWSCWRESGANPGAALIFLCYLWL